MDFLKTLFLLFIFSSCAKLDYLWEQGLGQVELKWNAIDNQRILLDPEISSEHKRQIKLIQKYKEYFYRYLDKKPSDIYSETTMLDQPAVTYLVIASPYETIKAIEHSFPLMGSFPYLGFFKESSAIAFEKKLQKDYVTYRRPVYAYSTLGYLNDPILSSFFHYDDFELAELIFHELFHTVFFIDDNVDFNENLANYFGEQMAIEYFDYSPAQKEILKKQKERQQKINSKIVKLTQELKESYKRAQSRERSVEILESFMKSRFTPEIQKLCRELRLKECGPLKGEWNNARFAAFLTYEKGQDSFARIRKQNKLNLKEFYHFLWEKYRQYKNERPLSKLSFLQYLEDQS